MLKLSKSLFNQAVVSLRTGTQIAIADGPIINPHNLKILGWWCNEAGRRAILLIDDVRQFMPNGLAVDDEATLSEPADLVRHKEIIDTQFELIDKLVRTNRHKLGRVSDFSYNDGLFVQKLYVSSPLHKVFSSDDTRIIDREQIIEVTDKYILVRDTEVKAGAEEMATMPVAPA
jgi:hypothetical protein